MEIFPGATKAFVKGKEACTSVDNNVKLEEPIDLIDKTGGGNNVLFKVSKYEETYFGGYMIPEQDWSLSFEVDGCETNDVAINGTIIGYLPDIIGKQKFIMSLGEPRSTEYLKDFVVVGVPTQKYHWLFTAANNISPIDVGSDILGENDGYTWMFANVRKVPPVECYIYNDDKSNLLCDDLETTVLQMKRNVTGVGYLGVTIKKAHGKNCCLSLTLNRFDMKKRAEL